MSTAFSPSFSSFSHAVLYLYDLDPAAYHKLIIDVLRAAGDAGFVAEAEALRDHLYIYESGQPL